MIRNVVVGRLRHAEDPGQRAADAALLREGLAGIAALRLPGMLAMNVGCDLGLRDGGWNFAITNDWENAEAYRGYDATRSTTGCAARSSQRSARTSPASSSR